MFSAQDSEAQPGFNTLFPHHTVPGGENEWLLLLMILWGYSGPSTVPTLNGGILTGLNLGTLWVTLR